MIGRMINKRIFLFFVFLCFSIVLIAATYYFSQVAVTRRNMQETLAAIGNLKTREIANWRHDRLADGMVIGSSFPVTDYLIAREGRQEQPALRARALMRLEQMVAAYRYEDISVVGLNGKIIMTTARKNNNPELDIDAKNMVNKVAISKTVTFGKLHLQDDRGTVGLHLYAPIIALDRPGHQLLGIIVMKIDPQQFLFPLIQTWPTPSKTAETQLVRREGNEVLYLNELRHKKNTALQLRFPLTNKKLPATMAALGQEGIVEGLDYRQVNVLAAIQAIPDSDWRIIAKIDTNEVYAPLFLRGLVTLFMTILLIGVSAAWLYWLNRNQTQNELLQARQRYEDLLNNINVGIYRNTAGSEGHFLEANPAMAKMFEAGSKEEFLKHNTSDFYKDPGKRKEFSDKMLQHGSVKGEELELKTLKGKDFWALVSAVMKKDENGNLFFDGVVEDITSRKLMEIELRRTKEELEKQIIIKDELTNKVQERTKQLEEKMQDLEKFNSLVVDRELKMIEYEKEVNTLLQEMGRTPKYGGA
ncbi:MAG: PAS domain-containing protein [Candidatus Margulisbacteria bacterium]|nr:PAS domain-containing protein [Candidatus Margulisiibacteriota bacterium]